MLWKSEKAVGLMLVCGMVLLGVYLFRRLGSLPDSFEGQRMAQPGEER